MKEHDMAQNTHEQQGAQQATDLSEAETTAFVESLAAFRDSLPPRQREVFTTMLAAAGTVGRDDVQGYFHQPALFRYLNYSPRVQGCIMGGPFPLGMQTANCPPAELPPPSGNPQLP
jgi:hypothetical protein